MPRRRPTELMRVYYSDHHEVVLPPGHKFPMRKYRDIRLRLLEESVVCAEDLVPAPLATREQILLAHDAGYVDGVWSGTLEPKLRRSIGLPWSEALVRRSRASVGGSLAAAESALGDGMSGNLAGGTHHARRAEGGGFCVFNDLAIVALSLLESRRVSRIAIVDLDVHQGDGTAAILGGRSDVYLLSVHGANNYPFRKVPGTLDVALPDGTGDDEYLAALEPALDATFSFAPELVLYQAGVDALAEDRFGRLALTLDGLRRRDALVLSMARARGAALMTCLGGGYAEPIDLSVRAAVATYRLMVDMEAGRWTHGANAG